MTIDAIGGKLLAPVLVGMYSTAAKWVQDNQANATTNSWTGMGTVLKWALYIQLLSWCMQLHPGHVVFEGAKPALLDSLGASFSSAPPFAFYEGIRYLGF